MSKHAWVSYDVSTMNLGGEAYHKNGGTVYEILPQL